MNQQDIIQAKEILQSDIVRYSKNDIPQDTDSKGLKAVLRHRQEKIAAYGMAIQALDKVESINIELVNLLKCYRGEENAIKKPISFEDYIQEIIDKLN